MNGGSRTAGDGFADAARLRSTLDHPIVDCDGHLIEPFDLLCDTLREIAGPSALTDFTRYIAEHPPASKGDADTGDPRGAWFPFPADAETLAIALAPALLAERMDDIGLDYTVLYPSYGLALAVIPVAEVRQVALRALNTLTARLTGEFADRMTAVACLPMHTPDEAIVELEHARTALGAKVAMIPASVARPWPGHEAAYPTAAFPDRYGLDSLYDYSPLWQALLAHRMAVTSHGGTGLRHIENGRRSPTNWMFNHIGGHAHQQSELAKSLVMGGVTTRFPQLRFAFLECGAGWAADLLHGLSEHWEKRSLDGLRNTDPRRTDHDRLRELLARYLPGATYHPFGIEELEGHDGAPEWLRDEFEDAGITEEEQFGRIFAEQFFLGCESDDPSVYRAFDARGNPFDTRLNAMFASDIGHWDVPDISRLITNSHQLVDRGLLTDDDYRDFAFTNVVRLHGAADPHFFDDTRVATAVQALTPAASTA
jgi:predicted TIM-barrel fold metal-dependent hydrolase